MAVTKKKELPKPGTTPTPEASPSPSPSLTPKLLPKSQATGGAVINGQSGTGSQDTGTTGSVIWTTPDGKTLSGTSIGDIRKAAMASIGNVYGYEKTLKDGLKSAGYKTGKGTVGEIIKALDTALSDAALIAKSSGQAINFQSWLSQRVADTAAAAARQPSTQINPITYQPQQIQSIAEQAYLNTVGRKPTTQELADITKQLNVQELKTPSTTKTVPIGTSTTKSTTSGGVDEKAFIQSQIEQNQALQPEVSRMKDINFSSWLMNAMTGGPAAAGGLANG
jgi:hypothetical protein